MSARGRGGLTFLEKGERMNAQRNQKVLEDHLLPFLTIHETELFMQDNAPCHTARSIKSWLVSEQIQTILWPPNSPDINPIENLWEILKQRVADERSTNISDLKNTIRRVWTTDISEELCKSLCLSMPKRIREVVKNKGYPSKY